MAFTITLNVTNDTLQPEGRDAFANMYSWEGATVPDPNNPGQTIPNPKGATKQQFLEYCLKQYYKEVIRAYRRKTAEQAIVVQPVGD